MSVLVVANAVSALFMTGVIWVVQVVHYPLFARVGRDGFAAYAAGHATRITAVIALPWAVEGVTSLALVAARPAGVPVWLLWAGAAAVGTTALATVTLAVPQHRRLGAGFDGDAHARLVGGNWLRTAAWTAHGAVATAILCTFRVGGS